MTIIRLEKKSTPAILKIKHQSKTDHLPFLDFGHLDDREPISPAEGERAAILLSEAYQASIDLLQRPLRVEKQGGVWRQVEEVLSV